MADEISRIEQLASGFKSLTDSSGAAVQALNEVNDAVLNSGKGMQGLAGAIDQTGNSLNLLSKGIGGIVGAVPGLGLVDTAFGALGDTIGLVTNVAGVLNETFMNSVRGVDALSAVNRELTRENFELAAQFGRSLEEAEKFTEFMIRSADELSKADFGFQNMATENRKMVQALGQQRLSFDVMQQSIQTTAGTFDLYSTAVLQAQALGLDYNQYASIMSDLILQQGMSTQEAAEALSIYGDLAGETGLTVSKISESLTGLGNSFRKMGLDATFGESFLKGFSDALADTGIGLDAVAEMTQIFGSRMAALSTNYGSAFITAMRGGMDAGSGGALGAGIQLQAAIMDPNTDQARLGMDIASAVRDTVASFTGGDIVTVQEAAQSRDPRMEQAYYMQTQLLGSMYGISDPQEQARTLELLQQMADAQTTGDVGAMESISADLQEAIGVRQETMSNEEKLNTMVAAQLGQLQQHTELLRMIAQVGQETLIDPAAGMIEGGLDTLFSNVPMIEEKLAEYAQQVERGEADTMMGAALTGGESPLIRRLAEIDSMKGDTAAARDQLFDFVKGGGELNINSGDIVRAIQSLPEEIAKLISGKSPDGGNSQAAGVVGRK
jgi:hypothetical protein